MEERRILEFKRVTGEKGFEPLTFGFGNHYSTIETILLKVMLYFLSQKPAIGVEPITFGLQNRYSTN